MIDVEDATNVGNFITVIVGKITHFLPTVAGGTEIHLVGGVLITTTMAIFEFSTHVMEVEPFEYVKAQF